MQACELVPGQRIRDPQGVLWRVVQSLGQQIHLQQVQLEPGVPRTCCLQLDVAEGWDVAETIEQARQRATEMYYRFAANT